MSKKFPIESKGFSPFRDLVGVTFTKVESGFSQCVLELNEKLLNAFGVLHGGAIFTMADSGMGGALYSSLDEDELCATVETSIVYFKPVTSGTITCNTKVIHRSKRIAILESEIRSGDRLVAKALGTFSIYKEKEPLNATSSEDRSCAS